MKAILIDNTVSIITLCKPEVKRAVSRWRVLEFRDDLSSRDRLQVYYKAIGCDLIDIVTVKIGGKVFDCICDDEALLKTQEELIRPCLIYQDGTPHIFGKCVIIGLADKKGDETSLSEDDISLIRHNMAFCDTTERIPLDGNGKAICDKIFFPVLLEQYR